MTEENEQENEKKQPDTRQSLGGRFETRDRGDRAPRAVRPCAAPQSFVVHVQRRLAPEASGAQPFHSGLIAGFGLLVFLGRNPRVAEEHTFERLVVHGVVKPRSLPPISWPTARQRKQLARTAWRLISSRRAISENVIYSSSSIICLTVLGT
jgi:hypothetical protein